MAALAVGKLGEHPEASRGSRPQKALGVTITTAAGIALLSCSALQPSAGDSSSTSLTVYEPSAPIIRAPLSPPMGSSFQSLARSSAPSVGNTNSRGADLRTPPHGTWRASPRWAAVKGDGCIVVEQNPESKIAAEAHARKFRVENCSQEDLDEINPTRIEEYGGY